MTRQEAETALAEGRLYILVDTRKAAYWKARRNGKTLTTKRDAGAWSIPVKGGFHHTTRITNLNNGLSIAGLPLWRIVHDVP